LVVIGVLVAVVLSALIAGAIVSRSDGHQDLAMASLSTLQTRSLAWSGVLGVVSELQSQREEIMTGEAPLLTAQWSVPTRSGEGVVRLIPWPTGPGQQERLWVAESSKLDVNQANAAMLAKLPGVSQALAARIVGQRKQGYECVESLSALGLSVDELYGGTLTAQSVEVPASSDGGTAAATETVPIESAGGSAPAGGEGEQQGLLNLLTTFAFDPNMQAGVGEGSEVWAGTPRINLSLPWSEALEGALKERFGEEVTRQAAEIFKARDPLTKDSQFVAILMAQGVPTQAWGTMLDIFTTSNDMYRLGRVDLLTAPAEVLAAIPGIDAAAGAKIVQMRESLSKEERQSIAWPVTEGVLTPQQFSQAIDWITTRPMQFRVRIEAGMATRDERGEIELEGALSRPMTLEAVIDLAGGVSARRHAPGSRAGEDQGAGADRGRDGGSDAATPSAGTCFVTA
jgi:DNA uptake protein ComE-like DNA-binding protein